MTADADLKVLLVDDDPNVAESLAMLLECMRCSVKVASSGVIGIELIQCWHPHLAIIDFDMPGMNGCDVAAAIRRQPSDDFRLLCLTGRNRYDVFAACKTAGFDEVITKPLDTSALERRLECYRRHLNQRCFNS